MFSPQNCYISGLLCSGEVLELCSGTPSRQSVTIPLSREANSREEVLQFYSPKVPAKVVTAGLQSWESYHIRQQTSHKRFIGMEESRRVPASGVRNSSKRNGVQSLYRISWGRAELSRVTLDWWIFVT